MSIQVIKAEAKSRGIRWIDVVDTYRGLRKIENHTRQHDSAIRELVWSFYCGPNSKGFWRHGMQVTFPHAFGEGDRTNIPAWDTTAKYVACEFPQFATDDPSEAVFEYVQGDYVRQTPAAEMYREAIEIVAAHIEDDTVPF